MTVRELRDALDNLCAQGYDDLLVLAQHRGLYDDVPVEEVAPVRTREGEMPSWVRLW